jgi:hypothetical protein
VVLVPGDGFGLGDHFDVIVCPLPHGRSGFLGAVLTMQLGRKEVAEAHQVSELALVPALTARRGHRLELLGLAETGGGRGVRTLHGAPPPSASGQPPHGSGPGNRR